MFNQLSALALGVVIFAVTIGVGVVVLDKFGDSLADCAYGHTYNTSNNICYNDSNGSSIGAPTNEGFSTTTALVTELGTSGLAGWTAAIIALVVGILFISALAGRRSY